VGLIDRPTDATMVAFPPGRLGVLLPVDDRATAALGVAMYTASKPWVVNDQRAAYWAVRLLGTSALPGRRQTWSPPPDATEWAELVHIWEQRFGAIDNLAVYRRRQASRYGVTMIATSASSAPVVIKLRHMHDSSLHLEQQVLELLYRRAPTTFSAPRPFGHGTVGSWQWSAQSAVFTRPHHPCLHAPGALFDEIDERLATMPGAATSPGHALQHGDLTPWNLRIDHRGTTWLFDWEGVAPLPPYADRAFFHATAAALVGATVDQDLVASVPVSTWDHWIKIVGRRDWDNAQDRILLHDLRQALSTARADAARGAGAGEDPPPPT